MFYFVIWFNWASKDFSTSCEKVGFFNIFELNKNSVFIPSVEDRMMRFSAFDLVQFNLWSAVSRSDPDKG
jgi:hypothetical protein